MKRSSIIFSILLVFISIILLSCSNNDCIEISYRDCGDYYAVEGPLSESDNSSKAVIKEKINGKEVKEIDSEAFYNCKNLNKISIPSTVTRIGKYAFAHTSLTDITIPESVEDLDCSILWGCDSLKSIVVNEKNKKYDSRNNCNAIIETETNALVLGCQSTIIPNTVISIGNYAFSDCDNLIDITIPYCVTTIGNSAFDCCSKLTTISIPNSVTRIEAYAFNFTDLKEIIIPSSVEYIDYNQFSGCDKLEKIIVDENNKKYDSRKNCNAIIETETNTLISGCKNTIIPSNVTSISDNAFSCIDLKELAIPSDVTSIGKYAFTGCDKLERIIVDENNKTFDSRKNCNAIIETKTNMLVLGCKNTIIPSNVTSISDNAFFGSSDLKVLIIPSSVMSIGRNAFYGCKQLDKVYYLGTIDQWNSISIEEENENLIWATRYYYS